MYGTKLKLSETHCDGVAGDTECIPNPSDMFNV